METYGEGHEVPLPVEEVWLSNATQITNRPSIRDLLNATQTRPASTLGSIADEDVPLGDPIENLRNAKLGYGVVLQKWRGREKEVDADRMRSDEGKLVTKQKELPEFEKQHLANLDTVVEGWVKRVEKLEADYTDVKQFTDADSAGAVRSAEIRSWFSKLDRATQIAKLHDAVRNNDTELTSAAISAPASMQLIAPEIRAHLIEAMIEKKYPNMVAEIRAHSARRWCGPVCGETGARVDAAAREPPRRYSRSTDRWNRWLEVDRRALR